MDQNVFIYLIPLIEINMQKRCIKSIGLLFTILFFFFQSLYISNRADDFVFQQALVRYGSFGEWMKYFSGNWSGRIIPQGLLVLLLQLPDIVFQTINALMWGLLLAYIWKIYDYRNSFNTDVALPVSGLVILSIIPAAVLQGAVFWKCANVSYLWGTALSLVAVYPFVISLHGDKESKNDFVYALLASTYACSFEQIAVYMSTAMFIFLLSSTIKNGLLSKRNLFLTLYSVLLTVYFYQMPGNKVRYQVEVIERFQKYDMFSLSDKYLLGIKYAIGNVEAEVPLLLLCISALSCYATLEHRRNDLLFKALCIINVSFFILNYINQTGIMLAGGSSVLLRAFLFVDVDAAGFGINVVTAFFELINVGMITFLGMSLVFIIPGETDVVSFVSYFGGIATMAIMGFSPAIYASAERPRFIGYLFLICTLINMLSSLKKTITKSIMSYADMVNID